MAAVNWIFNAWGEKYQELMADTRIACLINDDLKMECFLPGIVLEGGSIDVNGCGTVLTTEQCLLNKNRNPSLNKEEIESYLQGISWVCRRSSGSGRASPETTRTGMWTTLPGS